MKRLHMMVGLPYSGKSTVARELGHPIVCPDEIRLAMHGQRYVPEAEGLVWSIAKIMVGALFGAGHDNVTLDATNTTPKRRDEWLGKGFWVVAHWASTSAEVCRERARKAGDDEILPVIHRMDQGFLPPVIHEGYLRIEHHCP